MKKTCLIAILAVAVAGCASGPPVTPAQTVFTVKGAYELALIGAVGYESMPRCSATVSQPCSNPELVAHIRDADDVTKKALDAAEKVVRTPAVSASAASKAAIAAQAALAAFEALVPAKKGTL